MLAFVDESGHTHPNDPNAKSVIVACCLRESDSRRIVGRVHALKRDTLNRERMGDEGSKATQPEYISQPSLTESRSLKNSSARCWICP